MAVFDDISDGPVKATLVYTVLDMDDNPPPADWTAGRTGRLAAFVALDSLDGRPDTARRDASILQREHAAYRETHACCYREEVRWRDAPFRAPNANAGDSASFPLRFRHGARDNAVHRPTTVEDRRKPRNLPEC
jgi:hypothetical protein